MTHKVQQWWHTHTNTVRFRLAPVIQIKSILLKKKKKGQSFEICTQSAIQSPTWFISHWFWVVWISIKKIDNLKIRSISIGDSLNEFYWIFRTWCNCQYLFFFSISQFSPTFLHKCHSHSVLAVQKVMVWQILRKFKTETFKHILHFIETLRRAFYIHIDAVHERNA